MLYCECVCKELFPGKKNSRCCQVTTATVTSCRGTREDLYKCPVWSHNYENLFFNKVYYKPNVQLYACHHNLPFLAWLQRQVESNEVVFMLPEVLLQSLKKTPAPIKYVCPPPLLASYCKVSFITQKYAHPTNQNKQQLKRMQSGSSKLKQLNQEAAADSEADAVGVQFIQTTQD